jgi:hypothetical protein
MKIRLGVGELFHADWKTDMTKLTVAFRSFANAPKKYGERKQLKLEEKGNEENGQVHALPLVGLQGAQTSQ